MMSVVGSFSLARAICAHEPSYLDTVMVPFLKVMIRATKEHLSYVAAGQQGPIVKSESLLRVQKCLNEQFKILLNYCRYVWI